MAALPTVKLSDGNSIPWIFFGCGTALFSKDSAAAAEVAIKNGMTAIDSAQLYGNEAFTGEGIAAAGVPRSSLYITTKLGKPVEGQTPVSLLRESLKNLKVDYVDMYLIHTPLFYQTEETVKAAWKGLEEAHRLGLTKSIGVSNFNIKQLQWVLEVATIPPTLNQIEFHPYVLKKSHDLLALHKSNGIVTQSYAGLTPLFRVENGPINGILESIRARVEKDFGKPVTAGQILTKWQLQRDIILVTTTSKPERMAEVLAVPSLPNLTEKEISDLEAASETHYQRFFHKDIFD